jgi:hypothetical protein
LTGSPAVLKTIGMVVVVALAASAAWVPPVETMSDTHQVFSEDSALAAQTGGAARAPGVLCVDSQTRSIGAGMRDPLPSGLRRSRASALTKLSVQSVGTPMEDGALGRL